MRGKNNAIRQARKVNSQMGINSIDDLPVKLEKTADNYKIKIIYDSLSDDMSGVFFKKEGRLFLGVNRNQPKHRQRFTIAHEIGHYILHSKNEILHYDNHAFYRADNVLNSDEVEANAFAAELLMPEDLITQLLKKGVTSIYSLADKFTVSEDAMRYRLINLGYL